MDAQEKEEIVADGIRDGRYDVARALVEAVMGGWYDHAPYTDLAQEIVDDPYCGVQTALEEYHARLVRALSLPKKLRKEMGR